MSDQLSLSDLINVQIEAQGPMSLSTYMNLCLTHPTLGYYRKSDPLGRTGDFITAPEISQMFGEMLGVWVAQIWQQLDKPNRLTLVELGPGRGTLMADMVRIFQSVPGLLDALNVQLLETNPVLKQQQAEKIKGVTLSWVEEIHQLKEVDGPIISIANEFFDALPIKQFQYIKGNWYERLVGLKDGQRVWGLSPTPMPADAFPPQLGTPEENAIWEMAYPAQKNMEELGALLAEKTGALLAIDYGYAQTQTGETLQALEKHKMVDPLDHPGEADITAHVDFEALTEKLDRERLNICPLITQGQFLKAMGIEMRAKAIIDHIPDAKQKVENDLDRLIGAQQMGELFKVQAIGSKNMVPYPFEAG
ncbi:class I SAM-dependent methyltransferase [Maritalea mediterranea]|uniref:SAM-dependent methyltransferase n=1 Tax=Maritalea mediterranea TaxID=2909667 RepID=A0ABS9E889_9HYPH|nr:SAM-dependent methyltransferase [Maritalea mediterranea]MCF4099062.1 SAM-dependent methyltransferase [Maritalea mediterranea]